MVFVYSNYLTYIVIQFTKSLKLVKLGFEPHQDSLEKQCGYNDHTTLLISDACYKDYIRNE